MKNKSIILIAFVFLNTWLFLPRDLSYAADREKTLQDFVISGGLSDVLKKQVEEHPDDRFDVIVAINRDVALDKAKQMRVAEGLRIDNAEIIAEKAWIYKNKKSAILSDILPNEYTVLRDYDNLPVIYIEVNEHALRQLLNNPDVTYIGENNKSIPTLAESLPLIGAPAANNAGATGAGTSVAVLDTGVDYTLDAFGNCTSPGTPSGCRVAYAHDFTPSDDGSLDDHPHHHGTNVSGIVIGVAPDTNILGLDVFRTDGYAYSTDIFSALQWVSSNISNYNIKSVNMSLQSGYYTSPCTSGYLAGTISDLKSAGVLTVISSGNDNYDDGIAWPACLPDAVSVGAVYDVDVGSQSYGPCVDGTTDEDQVACFSNSASFLTMLAPGAIIAAAGENLSGTSQAAPHVAGAIAAIGDAIPSLTPDRVLTLLTSSGIPVTDGKNDIVKPRLNFCINSARIAGGSSYTSLQAAYNAAGNGATIQVSSPVIGDLNANRSISITLQGGYDCNFTASTGVTYIKGDIHTTSGSLSIGEIVMVQ